MMRPALVQHCPVQVGPRILDGRPPIRPKHPDHGVSDYVSGMVRTHQASGEADEFIGMLFIDLYAGNGLHIIKMPPPKVCGQGLLGASARAPHAKPSQTRAHMSAHIERPRSLGNARYVRKRGDSILVREEGEID